MPCEGRISAERRGRPETRSWAVLGHAGAAGVRRRLGRARLGPGSTCQQQMEEPSVIPAGLGAGCGGHDRRTKPRIYSLPSFHRQPLSASLRWIVPAFSLLQLFTGSPWCRHAHKERATGEAVPVPPALRVPLRPREHRGAIDPAGRACPGPGWAGGMQTHAGHPLLHRLWPRDCKEGAPKGLGLPALPLSSHTRFGGGHGS